MIRTARKWLPAVVVLAVLCTGLASAATLGSTSAANSTAAGAQPMGEAAPTSTEGSPSATSSTAAPTSTALPKVGTTPTTTQASPHGNTPAVARAGDPLANCASTAPATYRPATEVEFRAAMTRAWLLCAAPSFFGTEEAGLELRADGRWSKLERTRGGGLARAGGWGNEGAWDTVDVSLMNGGPTFQINFRSDGGGTTPTIPVFGDGSSPSDLSKVRLDNSGTFAAYYVPVAAGTTILPLVTPAEPGTDCDAREEPYAPTSEAELRVAMTGVWLLCAAPSFLGTDEAGLEIRSDGRWSKLGRTESGGLVRLVGTSNAGRWETMDVSAMNGRPTFQINFFIDGGDWTGIIPAFAAHSSKVFKVRLDNSGFLVADYVRGHPNTAISGALGTS